MDEFPHVRRVGAYLFFAVCSFGVSMLAYAIARKIGFNDGMTHIAASTAMIASFLTLRDMTTQPRALEKEAGR
jgi:NO-binding membrane sensor protein with MHYT domain